MVAVVVAAVKELYNKVIGNEEVQNSRSRQIASLKEENAQIKEQAEAEKAAKDKEINTLKSYLCAKDPAAAFCK